MEGEDDRDRLESLLAAAGDHAAMTEAAVGRVATWRWARGGAAHRPEPLAAERAGTRQPQPAPGRPADLRGAREYGYDAAGRMVLARVYGGSGALMAEEFLEKEGDRAWSLRYEVGGGGDWGPELARLECYGPHGMTSSSVFL